MIELKNNELMFAKVRPEAIIPTKEKENAGYDIYACFEEDYMIIPALSTKLIPTGIASAVSDKYYLQVHERGSTGSKGMKYGAGVVDSSYRGEIFVCINNVNEHDIVIYKHGITSGDNANEIYGKDFYDDAIIRDDKIFSEDGKLLAILYPYSKAIAQLIVHEVPEMDVQDITYEELKSIPSKRGTGVLGSSGK